MRLALFAATALATTLAPSLTAQAPAELPTRHNVVSLQPQPMDGNRLDRFRLEYDRALARRITAGLAIEIDASTGTPSYLSEYGRPNPTVTSISVNGRYFITGSAFRGLAASFEMGVTRGYHRGMRLNESGYPVLTGARSVSEYLYVMPGLDYHWIVAKRWYLSTGVGFAVDQYSPPMGHDFRWTIEPRLAIGFNFDE